MAENQQQLQATLQELRATLIDMDQLDDQTRQMLHTVVGDLQRLLQRDEGWTQEDVQPVNRDLRELLLRFETDHPQLTNVLGRIADGLANLGI